MSTHLGSECLARGSCHLSSALERGCESKIWGREGGNLLDLTHFLLDSSQLRPLCGALPDEAEPTCYTPTPNSNPNSED